MKGMILIGHAITAFVLVNDPIKLRVPVLVHDVQPSQIVANTSLRSGYLLLPPTGSSIEITMSRTRRLILLLSYSPSWLSLPDRP